MTNSAQASFGWPWAWLAVGMLGGYPAAARAADPVTPAFAQVQPLVARYCVKCHGGAKTIEGEVNLAKLTEAQALATRPLWKKALDVVNAHAMPPDDAPQPSPAERQQLLDWIADILSRPDEHGQRDPGRLVVRRLNRAEYNNTVADLFYFNQPQTYFRPDQGTLPESIRIIPFRALRPMVVDLPPDDVEHGYNNLGEVLTLSPLLMEKYLAAAGEVTELAFGRDAGKRGGMQRSRALAVKRGLEGREAARSILSRLAMRAYRRPVTDDELERLLKLFDQASEAGFDEGLKASVQMILASPHFLFRIEGLNDQPGQMVQPANAYELATRLSYFLWSSMPDDALFEAAANGQLLQPEGLSAQVQRMLKSPKAKALSENFAMQWLQLGKLDAAMPDPQAFPLYYRQGYLPQSMRLEAMLFFESVLVEDASILRFVDADYTYLNSTMARHYGITRTGDHPEDKNFFFWRRQELSNKQRGGVMTMAGVLTATSNATRTSPVRRGKWALETMLGAPPPPPLADVADLDAPQANTDGLSLRKKLEMHRSNPQCASCHQRMDPIGLSFEQYDAVGAWRTEEGGKPIDSTGTLSDGTQIAGAAEFKALLLNQRRDDFVRSLAEHLLTYAMGRQLDYYDVAAVREIQRATVAGDLKLSAMIAAVTRSYPFQHRRTQETRP